jgi:2-desacetyl-2-hydroxyethyl bacteriochlorophyllide A dehydrogenase
MKAQRLICTDKAKIEVESFDLPPLPDNGILVQNDVTTVSVGTETYNYLHGGEPGREVSFPRVTGYCNTGIVLEVGKQITDIQPGDRISGQGNHASHAILTNNYRKVPNGVSAKSAAFLVMGAIAIHGHRVARPELGESVAITGLGIVGQLAATFAKLAGAYPVIAIDLNDFRLQKANSRGLDLCLNPNTLDDLTETVRSHCVADGVDVLIEATGIPAVYPSALKLPRTGGRFVALGSPRGSVEVSFLPDIHLREITVLGAHQPKTPDVPHIYYPWTKERDRDFILTLMAQGKLPIEDLITHTAKPEDCQDIYTMLAHTPQDALGVVFEWA